MSIRLHASPGLIIITHTTIDMLGFDLEKYTYTNNDCNLIPMLLLAHRLESKVRSNLVFRPLPELLRASITTFSLRLHCLQKILPNGVESSPRDN
jgi:hypothetical protein